MQLFGTYGGTVENNVDPLQLGRVKVRVPHVYGASVTTVGYIGTNDLPWALPVGMPAGLSPTSGGLSQIPDIGDQVFVRFLDGEPEKPIWEWGSQTQKKTMQLHTYNGSNGAPDRAIWTRYSNSVELKDTQVTVTTFDGYQTLLKTYQSDTGGSSALQTPKGQALTLNDLTQTVTLQALEATVMSGKRVMLNAPTSTLIKTSRLNILAGASMVLVQEETIVITTNTGASIIIDNQGNIALSSAGAASVSIENNKVQIGSPQGTGLVVEDNKVSMQALQLAINTASATIGLGAVNYPVIMMTPEMLVYLLTHTHSNGNNGSPTGPPIFDPTFAETAKSTCLQTS